MSATHSTYYSFIQKPSPPRAKGAGSDGASPHSGVQGALHHGSGLVRRRQTAASPSCSSIATSSSSSNSNSSLNAFGAAINTGGSSMASPVSLVSPSSSSVSSSSSTSSSSSSGVSRQRELMRQTSLTPTQGVEMNCQLFHSCTLHSLEPKPLKPYKSNSEYLEAMKEDLAEWLNRLYSDLDLTPENLFQHLETGAIICRHANNVTQMGRNSMIEREHSSSSSSDIDSSGSRRNSSSKCQQLQDNKHQPLEMDSNDDSNQNEPNNNNTISSRSPSISLSSPNDSLQYQSYSIKSPPASLNSFGNSSLMMINSHHSPSRPHDYGNGSSYSHQKTINWFQIKMIPFKQDALAGTFHARDNICQFIMWCRSLNILECLLFETDDLVGRKNEKSFILCMLEVARIGFKVGMPTPLIIQLEQEIDREIEIDAKRQKELEEEDKREKLNPTTTTNNSLFEDCDTSEQQNELDNQVYKQEASIVLDEAKIEEKQAEDGRIRNHEEEQEDQGEEEEDELDFGPKPQVITNDLLSLHEKVVQLLCLCTCPTQFPMVRVGDNGKYKVGDKLIIFVRILRRHIMVRVGGGWQELSEFLRVKDPCRAKSPPHHQHLQYHNQNLSQNQLIQQQQQHQSKLVLPSSRSRLGESSLHLNKGGHHHLHQSYRNNSGQRLISGSASMSWLSHNS